jgi:hypothetical protein
MMYLLDILVHAFGMWLSYIVGHVVDELMRWSCCTSLMSHSLMHHWYVIGTLLEAPSSSMIGTCFMVDMSYMYEDTY